MLDKAKCYGTNCDLKESCLRFTKKDTDLQPYLSEVPIYEIGEDVQCDKFINTIGQCETAKKLLG